MVDTIGYIFEKSFHSIVIIWKDKKMIKQDLNVDYDTAVVDYEYGTAGQYAIFDSISNEISGMRRDREIGMKVVNKLWTTILSTH